jgi:uncharacterized protein (DUF427 family)
MTRTRLVPDENHPITVEPTAGTVTVSVGGRTIATSTSALTLREAAYPAVQYVPLADVDPAVLEASSHATYCPFKGEASYYDLVVDGARLDGAVWTYPAPYDAVAGIRDHVAFYPDRVEVRVDEPVG